MAQLNDVQPSGASLDQGPVEDLPCRELPTTGKSLIFGFTCSLICCNVLIRVPKDSWAGSGGVLLGSAIGEPAKGS